MRVDKDKIRTPDEEYDYLDNKLKNLGNYFSWEVHPNVVKATDIQDKRLKKKLKALVDSEEYKEYTSLP